LPFIPQMPSQFCYLLDPHIKGFVQEICDSRTISSFVRRVKSARRYDSELQNLWSWHYIELALMVTLNRPEVQRLFKWLTESELRNALYETSEFLTICSGVYGELPEMARRSFRARFNGMFNNPQGRIPLSHEMLTAHRLSQEGFKVEFVEMAEEDSYDFKISKKGVTVQLDCKSVSRDNGLFFDSRTGNVVHQAVGSRMIQQQSAFNGRIMHIQVVDRNRAEFDLGVEIRKALAALLDHSAEGSTHFQCSFVPFPDALMQELEGIALQGRALYLDRASAAVAKVVGLADKQLEGVYLAPIHALRSIRTALVLSSSKPHDWKANVVEAIKQSLDGQLRDQIAPTVCVRFNNLSDHERENLFWGQSSYKEDLGTALLSPRRNLLGDCAIIPFVS
jgi:hypothetical protein